MVFCAVRDLRRPTASRGAQRIEVRVGRAPSDEKETDARLKNALESNDENDAKAADELRRRQLKAAREAQRMGQQVHMPAKTLAPSAGQ
jgi:hypothetical protein